MTDARQIENILDQIVGPGVPGRRYPSSQLPSALAVQTDKDESGGQENQAGCVAGARRGRPLGKPREPAGREARAKATVWIQRRLIDQYPDWSWEARCPLSSLIQQAMDDFQKRRRRP